MAEGSLVKARDLEKIEEGWHLISWPSRAAVKEDDWTGGKSIARKIFSSHQTPLWPPDWTPGEAAAGMAPRCRAYGGEASRRPGPGRRPAGTRRTLASGERRRFHAWQLLSQCISPNNYQTAGGYRLKLNGYRYTRVLSQDTLQDDSDQQEVAFDSERRKCI